MTVADFINLLVNKAKDHPAGLLAEIIPVHFDVNAEIESEFSIIGLTDRANGLVIDLD